MGTVQMNVRINEAVKQSGDLAIKEAGYTPTKIINLMWSYMANNKHDKNKINNMLEVIDPAKNDERAKRLLLAKNIESIDERFADYCLKNSIRLDSKNNSLTADEDFQTSSNAKIRDIAYKEKFKTQG